MHVVYPAVVSALLFSIGVYGVLARRNTILVLMSVELMLNAVNLNLVAFDVWLRDRLHGGQVLTLFVIVIAAAEVGLGLAIILALYRNRQTVDLDRLRSLSDLTDTSGPTAPGTDSTDTGPTDTGTGLTDADPGDTGSPSPPRNQPPAESRSLPQTLTRTQSPPQTETDTRRSRPETGPEADTRPGDAP